MVYPAAAKRGHVEMVPLQHGVNVPEICDIVLGLVFLDCRNIATFAKVCDGGVKIVGVFFAEDPF